MAAGGEQLESMKANRTRNRAPVAGAGRRSFLRQAAGAAVAAGFPQIVAPRVLGRGGETAPSERVLIGLIGCGGRSSWARSYEHGGQGQIVALADPDDRALARWKSKAAQEAGAGAEARGYRQYRDFRELLASEVDAVHISAGDYWHVPAALLAARAGKHIYVEKPLGLSIEQDLATREIGAEHKVQVQYGTQQRSSMYTRGAVELVLNGHIGEVKQACIWAPLGIGGGVCVPEPVPAEIDYSLWLGPAPDAPYCKERCEVKGPPNAIFHVYDYAIGFVAGWGAHPYDQFQWWADEAGIGMPVEVQATGSIPAEGFRNTATHWDAQLRYANGLEVRFCDSETIGKYRPSIGDKKPATNGVIFVGTEGWIYTSRSDWEASSREILLQAKEPGPRRLVDAGATHTGNFLDAIRGRNKIVAPLESGMRSDICCHLTDLAIRHGGKLGWDAAKNQVTGNEAARAAMHRPMRQPWDVLNPKYTA